MTIRSAAVSLDILTISPPARYGDQRVELLVTQGEGESRTWTAVTAVAEWNRDAWGYSYSVIVTAERVVSVTYADGREVYLMQVPSFELSRLVEGNRKIVDAVLCEREAA